MLLHTFQTTIDGKQTRSGGTAWLMNRTIIGFHCDPEGDWVADLDCAHGQHMRHTPPFFERPWVLDPIERNARIGTNIQCAKCDQFVWPENLVHVKSTPEFERQTVPSGLLKDHATKAGIWGKVVLQDGQIRYYPEVLDR